MPSKTLLPAVKARCAGDGELIPTAVFALPSAITLDQSAKISSRARALVEDAIKLCRPRRAGFTVTPPTESELQTLIADCHDLCTVLCADGGFIGDLDEKEQAYDRFFGVVRGSSPDAFATGIVWGVIAMLQEMCNPHSLVPAEADALTYGFYRLVAAIFPSFVARPGSATGEAGTLAR